MSTLDYARERVNALLDEVERLTEVEFPHEHSERALEQLRDRFQDNLKRLAQFDLKSDLAIVQQTCRLVLVDLYQYLPLLGFVLRSTNVRNAFEVFGPLLRLAGDILEPGVSAGPRKTKLLLSSEWDFSPFTFPAIPALPDFLFIDLPAPESSNPLLLPLAGHELGHAVWIKRRLRTQVQSRAKQSTLDAIKRRWTDYQSVFSQPTLTPAELTTDLSALHSLSPAVDWCVKQAEETFGDFLGLRLFRESYLHSFSYLLSPGMGARSVWYPSIKSRVQNLGYIRVSQMA